MKKFLLVVFCLVLSGCFFSTPKSNFYILENVEDYIVSNKSLQISVQDVSVPDYLLRPQIVLQKNGSPQVEISEFHRWASDLPEMIQNTLILDLQKALPRSEIKPLLFGGKSKYIIKINLEKMTGSFKNEALLSGTWQILNQRGQILKQNSFKFSDKVAQTYASYVQAQSALLQKLSVEIAQSLSRL